MSDTPQGRLPKSTHLLKHSDFQRVYQQGHRHFSGNMTVFFLPIGEMPSETRSGRAEPVRKWIGGQTVRVGLTVPKSLGGAVERNRMRRRTREAVRHNLVLLNGMSAGVDVVINPKKGLLVAEFSQISREVERAFQVVRRACERGAKPRGANPGGADAGAADAGAADERRVNRGRAKKPATGTGQEAQPQ